MRGWSSEKSENFSGMHMPVAVPAEPVAGPTERAAGPAKRVAVPANPPRKPTP